MRSWLALFVVLALVLALGACRDRDVERLAGIKEKVCACKTASCAEQEIKRVPNGAPAHVIKSTRRTQVIARDMMDCLAKLQAAERPTTDPDAEDEGADQDAEPAATSPRTEAPASARTR